MKITIEGTQGEGKSRLASHVVAALVGMGFSVDLYDGELTTDPPEHYGPAINHQRARIYTK